MGSKRVLQFIITGDAKGLADEVDKIAGKFDGFGGGVTAALGGAGIAVTAFAGLVVGLGVTAYNLGEQFDASFDKIRVNTGETGAALEGLKGSFDTVLAGSASSMDDTSSAIALLHQRLDLTGKPLEDLSAQFLNFSRITGTNVTADIRSATGVFNNWNVATGDQGKTLDLLFRTMQQTGIGFDSLTAAMAEGGTTLRGLGFSLEDSAALFGRLDKAGVSASDVMAPFSKAIATATQHGVSAHQAFTNYFNLIKKAPNDIAAAQEGIQLFGAKAGPRLAEMIREGKLSFEDLKASIVGGSDTINAAAADTEDFSEKWQRFINNALVKLEPVLTAVFDGFGKFVDEGLMPQLDKLQTWFKENPHAVEDFAKAIQNAVQWAIEHVPGMVQTIGEYIGYFRRGIQVIKDWYEEHKDAINNVIGFIRNLVDVSVANFQTMWRAMGVVFDWLTNSAWPAVRDFGSRTITLFTNVKDGIVNAFNGIKDGIKNAINWVIDRWNELVFQPPDWVKILSPGMVVLDGHLPQIPRLHTGGSFWAPDGQTEGLALLRNGEVVSTPGSPPAGSGDGGGYHAHFHGPIYGINDLLGALDQASRDGARVPWKLAGAA